MLSPHSGPSEDPPPPASNHSAFEGAIEGALGLHPESTAFLVCEHG